MASMKFVLLLAVVATVCSLSAAFVDRHSTGRGRGGGYNPGQFPGTPPFNPGRNQGLPPAYHGRFRRAAEFELEPENLQFEEVARHRRDIDEHQYYAEVPEYYHNY